MALDFSALNVLVVDDNLFVRILLRDVLTALEFKLDNLRFAPNGEEALEALTIHGVDLIICDINMTPMDGLEFCRHVRMAPDSPDPYVAIIICTGHAEIERIKDARDAGANEILRKPITVQNLYDRMRAIIERPRPFVKSSTYHGPDRRRQTIPFKGPDRRLTGSVEI